MLVIKKVRGCPSETKSTETRITLDASLEQHKTPSQTYTRRLELCPLIHRRGSSKHFRSNAAQVSTSQTKPTPKKCLTFPPFPTYAAKAKRLIGKHNSHGYMKLCTYYSHTHQTDQHDRPVPSTSQTIKLHAYLPNLVRDTTLGRHHAERLKEFPDLTCSSLTKTSCWSIFCFFSLLLFDVYPWHTRFRMKIKNAWSNLTQLRL